MCNDYKHAADTGTSDTMCSHKTCLSKGLAELGVVNVICLISVCDGVCGIVVAFVSCLCCSARADVVQVWAEVVFKLF